MLKKELLTEFHNSRGCLVSVMGFFRDGKNIISGYVEDGETVPFDKLLEVYELLAKGLEIGSVLLDDMTKVIESDKPSRR